MTTPLTDKQIDQLIADYLAGSLREAHRAIFEDWLRASPKNPRRVARLSVTDYCIHEVCQDTKADYLLDVLNQIDDAAGPAQLVTLHHIDAGWHRYRLPIAIGGAIAAVLVIAITLIITLQGPSSEPSTIANTATPNMPAASAKPTPRGSDPQPSPTVATLTAEHDAVWSSPQAEGALAPGSPLRAGQRLTLTQGFAEITTNRGAIAIIQAPSTFELTDNNNAIHLHAGKLVGICDTESSHGFVVRTDHADITDLGTEFGVTATATATEATVFVGEVTLTTPDGAVQPITSHQTARVTLDSGTQKLTVEDHLAPGYSQRLPRPAIVTAARSSHTDRGDRVDIIAQGVREDAKHTTYGDSEINGVDEKGLPTILLGGDLVRTDRGAYRAQPGYWIELELAQPADLYLLFHANDEPPAWLTQEYTLTDLIVGIDSNTGPSALSVGPGSSIDNQTKVWRRKQPASGRVIAGRESPARSTYVFIVVPAEESL